VSKFPQHLVPILTSTVVECQRAGLKSSSYEYAAMLMRPEYRPSIDANLKRKIEAIVRRRSANSDDVQEELSPCPISGQLIPQTQLTCPTTRDALPMCIITGRHMLIDDWCFCPNSKLPALYSEYRQYIQDEHRMAQEREASEATSRGDEYVAPRHSVVAAFDPILGQPIALTDVEKTSSEDALKYIQKYNNVKEESKKKEGEVEAEEAVEGGGSGKGAESAETTKPAKKVSGEWK
jgi:WD repeat-containing protein 19